MQSKQTAVEKLNYEQAFSELESIVNALETNQPSLDEAMALFERGQALAHRCASLLDTAELRVRQLSDQKLEESEDDEDIA
jgi:exodeoxyribonuclease VII small subunit